MASLRLGIWTRPPADVLALRPLSSVPNVTRSFWGARRPSLTYGGTDARLFRPPGAVSRDSLLLATKRSAKKFERSGRLHVRASRKIRAPSDLARPGHERNTKLSGSGGARPRALKRFAPMTAPRETCSCRSAARFQASRELSVAIRRSAISRIPLSEEPAMRRISVVNDPSACGNYLALFSTAVRRMDFAISPALGRRGKEVAKSPISLFELCPKPDDGRNRRPRVPGRRIRAGFLSPPRPFRIPSGTPQLRRSYFAGALTAFAPHPDKALATVRTVEGEYFLIVKVPSRNNFPGGCNRRRPCLCGLASPRAQQLCPVHIFWPLIRRRVAPGAPFYQPLIAVTAIDR